MYEYELPKREQLPNEFGAGEECPPKRPNKTRCKAPPIEIPEPFTIMAPYLMVGASSSSWREGVRNTVEAPPAERGLLLRRAPLPVPASLVHCCSLMVQTRLVLPQVALVVVECMFRLLVRGACSLLFRRKIKVKNYRIESEVCGMIEKSF